MNEVLRGTAAEVDHISTFLDSMRRVPLVAPPMVPRCFRLSTLLSHTLVRQFPFDAALFNETCNAARRSLAMIADDFSLLEPSRFIVGALAEGSHDAGGFHSQYAHGFRYFSNYGLGITLNNSSVRPALKTLELARTYVHDSIHASTFRSFRLYFGEQTTAFPVFREQYGLNFRRPSGVSYSAPHLTKSCPLGINLNLLMDGVTVLMVRAVMEPFLQKIDAGRSRDEQYVLGDLRLIPDSMRATSAELDFYQAVVAPSAIFVEQWGGTALRERLFAAMVSGRLKSLSDYFNAATGTVSGWKQLFLSPSWPPATAAGRRAVT